LLFGHLFYSGLFPKTLTSILPNPIFFLERLGYILVLFYLCWIVDRKTNAKNSFVMDASRESLLVYWLHLIIIYGVFWSGKSLADKIGMTMNIVEAMGATILLIALMILTAKLWGWLKKNYSKLSSIALRGIVILLLILFFTG
jgi:fucose 4-O-acetylase-like acetyltransferase